MNRVADLEVLCSLIDQMALSGRGWQAQAAREFGLDDATISRLHKRTRGISLARMERAKKHSPQLRAAIARQMPQNTPRQSPGGDQLSIKVQAILTELDATQDEADALWRHLDSRVWSQRAFRADDGYIRGWICRGRETHPATVVPLRAPTKNVKERQG